MTLGEKITKQRKELNYTQEQLADILGVSRQSISKWESDIAYPETDKLIELGKLFDCSMDYLLKEDVTEKSDVQASGFTEKVEEISRKVMTDKNKGKAKKILKIIGIILAVVLVIDIISMILYFGVMGTPHSILTAAGRTTLLAANFISIYILQSVLPHIHPLRYL